MGFEIAKKSIRIIARTKCSYWHDTALTAPLFAMLKLLNVYDIHKLQVASFMFTVNHYILPVYFCNMFTVNCNIHMHNIAMIIIGNLIELV